MRILCVSDLVDPLVYSSRIKERFGDVGLVLAAGDLPMEYLSFISSMLNRPLLYVEGNHDLGRLSSGPLWAFSTEVDRSFGAQNIGFRLVREGNLILLGLPGSMRYNNGPNQFSEFEMGLRILALLPRLLWNRIVHGRAVDIILTHAAPWGIHDRSDLCHRGFRAFRWLMGLTKPRWLVHGHIHLYDLSDARVTEAGETTVINAFGHWALDTETES